MPTHMPVSVTNDKFHQLSQVGGRRDDNDQCFSFPSVILFLCVVRDVSGLACMFSRVILSLMGVFDRLDWCQGRRYWTYKAERQFLAKDYPIESRYSLKQRRDPQALSWCSGYHICLTRRRSPVRSWVTTDFLLFFAANRAIICFLWAARVLK